MSGSNDVDMTDYAEAKDPFSDFDTRVCLRNILDMAITSKHLTSRDKHEIKGQHHLWGSIAFLEKNATSTDKKLIVEIVANIKAVCRHMNLYYLVGKYGWEVALRSIAAKESTENSLPEYVPAPPKPQIIYRSVATHSRNSASVARSNHARRKAQGTVRWRESLASTNPARK